MPQGDEEPKFTPAAEMFSASVSLVILHLRTCLFLPRSSGSRGVCLEYVLNMKLRRRARGYADRQPKFQTIASRRDTSSSSLATGRKTRSPNDSLNC